MDIDPDLVKYVLRCLFVDDNLGGADNSTEAFEMYKKLKRIFLEAGFNYGSGVQMTKLWYSV